MEDKYFLRRESESKVFFEEVQDLDTNVTLLDENLVLEHVHIHIGTT